MFFPLRRISLGLLLAGACLVPLVPPAGAADAELAPLAEKSLLLDGQAVTPGRMVAVGERGHILISVDAGRSWRQSPVPTRATLTSVFFVDGKHGWAAGHDAVILATDDGGATWRKVHEDLESGPILDLWFRDLKNGYAVGGYGLFLATTDGGASWEPQPVADASGADIDLHFNQLHALTDGRLILAGEAGQLLLSADGRQWRTLELPYEGSLFGTLSWDDGKLLAFGLRGHLFRSVDAGGSWQPVVTGTEAILNDAIRLQDGRVVVVGLAGTVLVSSDEGRTFVAHAQFDRPGIARVIESNGHALVLLGTHGARYLELPVAGGRP